jgi:hypothetical protein
MGRRSIRGTFLKDDGSAEEYYKLLAQGSKPSPTLKQETKEEPIPITLKKTEEDYNQRVSEDVFAQIKEQEVVLEDNYEESYGGNNLTQLMNNESQGPSQLSYQEDYAYVAPQQEEVVEIKQEKKKTTLSKSDLSKLDIDEIFKKVDRFKDKSPMK